MKKFALVAVLAVSTAFLAGCSHTPSSSSPMSLVPTVLAQTPDFTYETYTEKRFNELKGSEAFTVFVHSKSCGTCTKKNQQIVDQAGDFTSGMILKMDWDGAPKAFKDAYGVVKYDTFVRFDAAGNHTTNRGATVDEVRSGM